MKDLSLPLSYLGIILCMLIFESKNYFGFLFPTFLKSNRENCLTSSNLCQSKRAFLKHEILRVSKKTSKGFEQ